MRTNSDFDQIENSNDYASQREGVIQQMMAQGYPRDIAEHEVSCAEKIAVTIDDDDIEQWNT